MAFVVRSADFLAHFTYPGFSGPLYPLVLSPFVAMFGIQAIPLKSLSLVFILGFIFFTYKAFKGRISSLLLTALLILVSINSFILYYASQTYSEAFFMLIQALTFYVFFTLFIAQEHEKSFRQMLKQHMILSVCVLALGITRTVGLSVVIVISAYFLLRGQWKNLLFFIISFTIVFALFQAGKFILWGNSEIHFTGQFENFVAKNYYDTGGGREDFRGFVNRLLENSNFYFSDSVYSILGIRKAEDANESYLILALLTWLLLISSTVISFWKNKYLLFTGLYAVTFIFVTFLLTQTIWRQSRLIIPYFPLILLMILSLFFSLLSYGRLKKFQFIFPILVLLLFSLEFKTTAGEVSKARQIEGKYYGMTPDWENYCKISEWASENLPGKAFVACRKPSVSFIYGKGKRFFGITRVNTRPGDSLMQAGAQKKLRYYYILTSSIDNHSVSNTLSIVLKSSLAAYGMINESNMLSNPFYVMKFPESIETRAMEELNKYRVRGTGDIDTLKSWLPGNNSVISFVYPDSLLNYLKRAGVTHVITANLRADATENNGITASTVERFMALIRFKYPDIMTKIIQVGSDDNEPAVLYQINYDKAVSLVP
ncbi:MAG: hypothetical protein NTW31_10685 [Bacteroidetes bacterium]|nr:hypothetical protein [Bacteroidota bacterium]